MKKNMGIADRIIRLILAAIIILLISKKIIVGAVSFVLIGFAVIFVFTSIISFCPLYTLFGLSTCQKENKN
jgi:hypothetical protein